VRAGVKNAVLVEDIRRVHADSDGAYGKRRVTMQLRREGQAVNPKRVERLMRAEGIVGAHVPARRRRDSDGVLGVAGVRAWRTCSSATSARLRRCRRSRNPPHI